MPTPLSSKIINNCPLSILAVILCVNKYCKPINLAVLGRVVFKRLTFSFAAMSRSRRRGGVSSGFANLRDSVRRRLFDPYAEPAVVDPRVVVAQLIPLRFGEPYINSAISQSDSGPSQGKVENLQLQLVR